MRTHVSLTVAVILALPCIASAQSASLVVNGGRLGDQVSIDLTGTGGSSGLLAFDVGPGPIPTPLGPIELDLSPALLVFSVTLDVNGMLSFPAILPADPTLDGTSLFTQAILGGPAGFALTNGGELAFRVPRIYFFADYAGQFFQPDLVGALSLLSDVTEFQNQGSPAGTWDLVAAPQLDALIALRSNDTLLLLDPDDGSASLTLPLSPGIIGAQDIRLGADGTSCILFRRSAFGVDPAVQRISFSPLSVGPLVTLPGVAASEFTAHPQTSLAYWESGNVVIPIDYDNGIVFPSITQAGPGDQIQEFAWLGSTLYTLCESGSSLCVNGIDTATQQALAPMPAPAISNASGGLFARLRVGPGPTGTSLFVLHPYVGASAMIAELSPTTLTVLNSVNLPFGTNIMEVSTLGTEWIVVGGAQYDGTILRMDAATLGVNILGSLMWTSAVLQVLPARSDSVGACYVYQSNTLGEHLTRLDTDPLTTVPSAPTTTINWSSPDLRLVNE